MRIVALQSSSYNLGSADLTPNGIVKVSIVLISEDNNEKYIVNQCECFHICGFFCHYGQ